jgi:glycosyltransferase involved in cell wall biosynthesis
VSASSRPRVGFVLEHSLGHVTHADNLTRVLRAQQAIETDVAEIPFAVDGIGARIPGFKNNWTVRAGVRARRAVRAMRRRSPLDALFIHTQVPAVLCADLERRIPTVVSLDATPLQYDELGEHYGHTPGNARVEAWKTKANRACLANAAHLVAWAEWTKSGIVDGYGIEPTKVTVIPPGVTPSLWRRREPPPPADGRAVRILFVGGDLVRKGGDVLLEAFARLRADLAAAGRPDAAELHLATPANVAPAPGVVVHHGMKPNSPELVALYHASDVFCLPTRGDCLPMVLSEAGAAALPLVSTAVAGIPEIARDGETGLLVPIGDAAALGVALRRLVDDPALRRRLGEGAAALVDARYDAEANACKLVELLVDVAAHRPVRSGT